MTYLHCRENIKAWTAMFSFLSLVPRPTLKRGNTNKYHIDGYRQKILGPMGNSFMLQYLIIRHCIEGIHSPDLL